MIWTIGCHMQKYLKGWSNNLNKRWAKWPRETMNLKLNCSSKLVSLQLWKVKFLGKAKINIIRGTLVKLWPDLLIKRLLNALLALDLLLNIYKKISSVPASYWQQHIILLEFVRINFNNPKKNISIWEDMGLKNISQKEKSEI